MVQSCLWRQDSGSAALLADLLHVQVEHVAREAGDDLPVLSVVLPCRVEVSAAGDPQPLQPSADSADAVVVAAAGEFQGDAASRPLAVPSPGVDELEDLGRQPRRTPGRSTGAVLKSFDAVVAVAVDPLRECGAGDACFGGDVGDGTAIGFDTFDQAEPSGRGQRRITVGHGTGLFQQMDGFSTTHRAGQGPVPSSPIRDYNVMTRNTAGGSTTKRSSDSKRSGEHGSTYAATQAPA